MTNEHHGTSPDLDLVERDSLEVIHVADVELDLGRSTIIGDTPGGHRQVFDVPDGTISGPFVHGNLVTSSGDWMILGPDDVARLDVRCVFRTNDGALVQLEYSGMLTEFTSVSRTLAAGSTPEVGTYYFRTAAKLETAAEAYQWLNELQCVGYGTVRPGEVQYRLYALT